MSRILKNIYSETLKKWKVNMKKKCPKKSLLFKINDILASREKQNSLFASSLHVLLLATLRPPELICSEEHMDGGTFL